MAKDQKKETQAQAQAKAPSTDELAQEVQEKFDKETAQGFRGVEVDQTPNENYTVQGVVAGKDTPETKKEDPNA